MRMSTEFFDIEISTPPDPERAFRRHTTYITGRWARGPVFVFKKVGAFDRRATAKAAYAVVEEASRRLHAVENIDGAGI